MPFTESQPGPPPVSITCPDGHSANIIYHEDTGSIATSCTSPSDYEPNNLPPGLRFMESRNVRIPTSFGNVPAEVVLAIFELMADIKRSELYKQKVNFDVWISSSDSDLIREMAEVTRALKPTEHGYRFRTRHWHGVVRRS